MAVKCLTALAIVVVGGCGFNPSGEGPLGDGDAPGVDADSGGDGAEADGAEIDAAVPDAPVDAAIDALPIDARPPCPTQYDVPRASGLYDFRQIAAIHFLAEADCADDLPGRTHLATWEVAAGFDDDIAAIDPGNSAVVFVGGICGDTADCADMANWTWVTGGAIDASLWGPGQPNNGLTQKRLMTHRPNGTWVLNNIESSQTLPYICECDP